MCQSGMLAVRENGSHTSKAMSRVDLIAVNSGIAVLLMAANASTPEPHPESSVGPRYWMDEWSGVA